MRDGPRRADVVLTDDFQHTRTGHTHDRRRTVETQDRRRHDPILRTVGAGWRQPPQSDREDDDCHQARPEGRHRDADKRKRRCQAVKNRILPRGGDNTHDTPTLYNVSFSVVGKR